MTIGREWSPTDATNDLVSLLERDRSRILMTYRASPYADEASANEYLVCWYHFFYAAVTNRLRDTGATRKTRRMLTEQAIVTAVSRDQGVGREAPYERWIPSAGVRAYRIAKDGEAPVLN